MLRKSFSIHSDYYEELNNLSSDQRGNIMLALIKSAMDEEIPDLDPVCSILFRLMKAQTERISAINAANRLGSRKAASSENNGEERKKRRGTKITERNEKKQPYPYPYPIPKNKKIKICRQKRRRLTSLIFLKQLKTKSKNLMERVVTVKNLSRCGNYIQRVMAKRAQKIKLMNAGAGSLAANTQYMAHLRQQAGN